MTLREHALLPKKTVIPKTPSRHQQVLAPVRVMAAVIQVRARDTLSVPVTLIEEVLAPIRVMAAVIQGRARDTMSVQDTLMIMVMLSLRVTRTVTGTYTAIIIDSTHMANLCTKLQRVNGTMINGAMIIASELLTIQSSLDSRTLTVQSWEFLPIPGI